MQGNLSGRPDHLPCSENHRFAEQDLDNLLTLTLEAHNDERNHHRRYEIVVGKDLFNEWTLTTRFGRLGKGGQEKRFASPDPETMRKVFRNCLRRRLSAPSRIGCAYRLTGLDSDAGFDAAYWVSAEHLQRFE